MLRGKVPPQVFNHRRMLFSSGPFLAERSFRRALLSPCTFLTGPFDREAFALGPSSAATLFGAVSRCVPRSIAIGQAFCVDACASVLD